MSDSKDFDNQYRYDEMSNKVIQPERRFRDRNENTNPISLAGQISVKDMGIRNKNIKEGPDRAKNSSSKAKTNTGENVLFDGFSSYHPTNEDAAEAFELMITEVSHLLSDQSHQTIIASADAVLEILKNEDFSVKAKRQEINELLDMKVPEDSFDKIVNVSNRITDYRLNTGSIEDEDNDEDNAVAIAFEDTDDENAPEFGADLDDGENGEDNEVKTDTGGDVQDQENSRMDNELVIKVKESVPEETADELPLHSIDQFFLQREISRALPNKDQSEVQNIRRDIFSSLEDFDKDGRELEENVFGALDHSNFDFVRKLINNRWRIVYKMRILDADNNESKLMAIIEEMKLRGLTELVREFTAPDTESLAEYLMKGAQQKRKRGDSSGEIASDEVPRYEVAAKKVKTQTEQRSPRIVDLENYTFDQGSHLMSTTKVKLPDGSFRQNKKLYDIISVPAPEAAPLEKNEALVKISELPDWVSPVFPSKETHTLNRIQSKIYPAAFKSDENLLLCAPTGAGKTNVAILTVLRTLQNFRDPESGNFDVKGFKIVYVAPLKALVQEQVREFQRRLTSTFGIVVNELTGDSSLSRQQIRETQILVTTPEKWDVVTRKPNEFSKLVKLMIIDEVHLLHDERGPVLESIVSRTSRQWGEAFDTVRLVGLSATLPNYKDVAKFLRVDLAKGLYYFDATYRPCPLAQQFIGIKEKKAMKKVHAMNEACYEKLIENLDEKHQVIIFVHSRKDTFKTAQWLLEKLDTEIKSLGLSVGAREILRQESELIDNRNLKEVLPGGIGIHHAGLKRNERTSVEDLFAQGHIRALVSTATLAWGVNLPAHTVIIKGTETYSPEKGDWVQLSPQDILQMLGRAGRPRYDKNGEGIIITSEDELQYYLAILNQQLPIESQLMARIPDALNAEVVFGSVQSLEDAIGWLGYTYLYIRMLEDPKLYHVGAEYTEDDSLYWKRADLAHSALMILRDHKLIHYDTEKGSLRATELGRIASHFYINYATVSMYNTQLKSWSRDIDILRIFARSGEFRLIPMRLEEKLEVQKLMEKCPIPIKEPASDPVAKVIVLLQTYISRLTLEGFALMADMVYITQSAGRLLRAIYHIALRKNWAATTKNTLSLCKIVEKRMWLSSSPFRQFGDMVPKEVIRTTENSLLPFSNYFDLGPEELAESVNLRSNSHVVFDILQQFPRLSLSYYAQPITPDLVRIQVEAIPEWNWNPKVHSGFESFLLLIEDCDGDRILQSDEISIARRRGNREYLIDVMVSLSDPIQPNYFVSLISDKWLHSEWKIPIMLSSMTLPKGSVSYTPLLDLQSVPTSELTNVDLMGTFLFSYFNKIQTQVFGALFRSSENLFIGATKGSGKTACGELAMMNLWRNNGGRIVYINPCQENIDKLYKVWTKKYLVFSDKVINKLSDDSSKNNGLLASSHVILATPGQFDLVSRRWKQRRAVRSIELLIFDDVHRVGDGSIGFTYESVISRMRYISTQVEHQMRFIGISVPLFNSRVFGEWLGCSKSNIFNFEPSQRFHKIEEIRIHSNESGSQANSDFGHFLSFVNSGFESKDSLSDSYLAFVPSRKEAVELSLNYIQWLAGKEIQLLKGDVRQLSAYLNRITDGTLKVALGGGIGLYYQGMNHTDKLIVMSLYEKGIIPVMIATKDTSSHAPLAANVVILGTQEYDGRDGRMLDYPIAEVLEMVGCCQDKVNDAGKVLLVTTTSKSNYYNKFLVEGLPVESYLNLSLHDAFMNEVSSGAFQSRQDCVDWITYTYFYRRIQSNPSFYDVNDTSHLGLSEYLSELVEQALKELSDTGMIELEIEEDENDEEEAEDEVIAPLNGSMIASYYNILFETMKHLTRLDNKTRIKGIIEAITSASEFDNLPVREDEETTLKAIYRRVPIKAAEEDYDSPHFKAFILLQAHFSRIKLPIDLQRDQKLILSRILAILFACIDSLSGEGHLNAIQAMDISQMIVQAVWKKDTPLRQIPNFDDEIVARLAKAEVESVYDLMAMEDDGRDDALRLSGDKLNEVAEFVNKYPNVDLTYELNVKKPIVANEPREIKVTLERDEEMEDLDVIAPFYPQNKTEAWWIVVGDAKTRQLYSIKKKAIGKELQSVSLELTIPNAGHHELSIWCICDSYMDADKEVTFEIDVVPESNKAMG